MINEIFQFPEKKIHFAKKTHTNVVEDEISIHTVVVVDSPGVQCAFNESCLKSLESG